jgi:RNA-directed DNA polymerase
MQKLVALALEPEWEAKFEPNSYGFRPGRSTHDAIEAIFNHIRLKPKYVLDADIEKCFDRIDRSALLEKLNAIQPIQRLVRRWLEAGILDGDKVLFPEAGVPQGGVASPPTILQIGPTGA